MTSTQEATPAPDRPDSATDAAMAFLDKLRESGAVNIHGAPPYLQAAFGLDRKQAVAATKYWMGTKQ